MSKSILWYGVGPPDTSKIIPVLPSNMLLQAGHQTPGDFLSSQSSAEDRADPTCEEDEVPAERTGTGSDLELAG